MWTLRKNPWKINGNFSTLIIGIAFLVWPYLFVLFCLISNDNLLCMCIHKPWIMAIKTQTKSNPSWVINYREKCEREKPFKSHFITSPPPVEYTFVREIPQMHTMLNRFTVNWAWNAYETNNARNAKKERLAKR